MGPVIEVFVRILHDAGGRVQYHYVLVDYVCRPVGGTLTAASDVADVAWVDPGALAEYQLTEKAVAVIGQALTLAAASGWTAGAAQAPPDAERSAASSRKGI